MPIITFGLYWFFVIRKRTSDKKCDDVKTFTNDQKNNKNIESDIHELENDLTNLRKKIAIVPIEDINYRIKTIEKSIDSSEGMRNSTIKYNKIKGEIVIKNQDLQNNDAELSWYEQKKAAINEKINNSVKSYFKSFDIDLLNQDKAILIKQNGIEWKHLNSSAKQNIIYELNDFLKKGVNLNTFSLIDNAESINQLEIKNDSQYIIAEVTKGNKLTLNDEEIY